MLWWTLKKLESHDPNKRRQAVIELGASGNPRAVQPLIEALRDPNIDVCYAAVEALGIIGDPRAMQPLLHVFNHQNEYVRASAAHALLRIPNVSPDGLVTALVHADPADGKGTCEAAWSAVIRCGSASVGPLVAAWPGANAIKKQDIINILGEIGDKCAADPLAEILKDKNYRSVAAFALGKLRDPRAAKPLVECITSRLGGRAKAVEPIRAMLISIGAPAVRPLLEELNNRNVCYIYSEDLIGTLEKVLQHAVSDTPSEDLRAVVNLKTIFTPNYREECQRRPGEPDKYEVDCSYMKQLARQELIRRGLDV